MAQTEWRRDPGYLSPVGSDLRVVQVQLERFLADRHSPDSVGTGSLLADNPRFAWGEGPPLEKVVTSAHDLAQLLRRPALYRRSVAVIEPWEHVGHNPLGEAVRASVNVAYLAQRIADCDSILYPVWQSGLLNLDTIVATATAGAAVVVQGGDPSVHDPSSFDDAEVSLPQLVELCSRLLLERGPGSAPAVFICLGHQLAGAAHVALLQRATAEIADTDALDHDPDGRVLRDLKDAANRITTVGRALSVRKHRGERVAKGWQSPEFAVARNELVEVGHCVIRRYEPPAGNTDPMAALVSAHELTAIEHDGVIDTAIQHENDLTISMFHADEVNEEAILLANWAYRLLHRAVVPHRHVIANGPLSWLLSLPTAVEILCSTTRGNRHGGMIVTECSATCISYADPGSSTVRRSFTVQFHPELLADLRAVGQRPPPSYGELKADDGARLFARMLLAGLRT